MAYQQLRKFHSANYTGGWCLKAVQECFIPPDNFKKVGSATEAWQQEVKSGAAQTTLPPLGVDVPIWFSLGTTPLGHITISLSDGRVASSSLEGYHQQMYIHKNITDLLKFYGQGIKYLGWSCWLEGVQIAKTAGVPNGYEKLATPRHGAVYKKTVPVVFACSSGKVGDTISFLNYGGKDFKPVKSVKLTSDHTVSPLDTPRSGAKVKFTKDAVVGFDENLKPKFINQSGVDWI